ncbi:MAG: hypothetical protein NDJ90_11520 [Oligoflexia bacterium]|nr:hypothetical protein [Oligoflexia bacterium]
MKRSVIPTLFTLLLLATPEAYSAVRASDPCYPEATEFTRALLRTVPGRVKRLIEFRFEGLDSYVHYTASIKADGEPVTYAIEFFNDMTAECLPSRIVLQESES